MALEEEEPPKPVVLQPPPVEEEEELPHKGDAQDFKLEEEEKHGEEPGVEREEEEGRQCRKITACPHFLRQHYAKGMCKLCYAKRGREKRAWKCPHTDKPLYAKGRC